MAVTIIVAIVAVVIVASAAVVVVSTAAAALPPRVVRGRRRRRGRVRAAAEVARVRAGGAARVRVAAAADGSEVGDCVLPQCSKTLPPSHVALDGSVGRCETASRSRRLAGRQQSALDLRRDERHRVIREGETQRVSSSHKALVAIGVRLGLGALGVQSVTSHPGPGS